MLAVLALSSSVRAQGFLKFERDSVPFFQGVAVSVDLAGAAQLQLSDYGQLEAALRVNLHNQYFPTFEVGLGKASHEDDQVTGISYRTKAPYFRLGADVNLMKKKHTGNRIFAGVRYACTYYKVDMDRQNFPDPVWKWDTGFGVRDEKCNQHWAEVLLGIDAKVAGPLHLGWSVRYRKRLFHDDGQQEKTWYVPGYGIQESTRLGYTFNLTIDI
ncbi:MAG: hypothetical protein II792_06225 [Prevotella sp.]|nr:hypothetical protein [Prevotella sp.]